MRLRRRADASPRRIRARRGRLPGRVVAGLLVTAVVLGVGLAERRSSAAGRSDAAAAEALLVPLLDELDATWSPARSDGPGPALVALATDGARPDVERAAAWEAAHAALVLRIVGLDLPPSALGAQRQAILAVTLSRDAVAVMTRAAVARDAATRDALAGEAVRMRGRGEWTAASALASIEELRTGRRRIAPPPVPLVPPAPSAPAGRG
jgi:hypothetical protein